MTKKFLLLFIVLIFISCKKDNGMTSNNVTVNHYHYDTIYDAPKIYKDMFSYLPKYKNGTIKLKTYSNTGLSETMLISNNNKVLGHSFSNYFSTTSTYDTSRTYSMLNFQYTSSIYGFNFQIVAGYLWSIEHCFNFKNLPGFGYLATWNIDSSYWGIGAPNYMIRFKIDSTLSTRLGFPISDNSARSLVPHANCYLEIGDYKIGNKNFQNVCRFKNEYASQNNILTSPYYIWIDKNYGVVSFQMMDSTKWNLEF